MGPRALPPARLADGRYRRRRSPAEASASALQRGSGRRPPSTPPPRPRHRLRRADSYDASHPPRPAACPPPHARRLARRTMRVRNGLAGERARWTIAHGTYVDRRRGSARGEHLGSGPPAGPRHRLRMRVAPLAARGARARRRTRRRALRRQQPGHRPHELGARLRPPRSARAEKERGTQGCRVQARGGRHQDRARTTSKRTLCVLSQSWLLKQSAQGGGQAADALLGRSHRHGPTSVAAARTPPNAPSVQLLLFNQRPLATSFAQSSRSIWPRAVSRA